MERLQIFFLFLLGLCVGSFLNVVVYRLNEIKNETGGIFTGRSFCPRCRKKLLWWDNIPLISFFLLRGRCRFCHSPISWQYPLVELSTALVTLLVIFHLAGAEVAASSPPRWPQGLLGGVIFYLLITYALMAIFASDLRYQTIPDEIVYPAMVVTVLHHLRGGVAPAYPVAELFGAAHLGGVLLAGFAAAAFFWLLVLVTQGKGMGMGDVKLAGLMGLILGYPRIVVGLLIAFLTGAIAGVILILLGKRRFGEHIPFGPFLVLATAISWLWGLSFWNWYWFRLLRF